MADDAEIAERARRRKEERERRERELEEELKRWEEERQQRIAERRARRAAAEQEQAASSAGSKATTASSDAAAAAKAPSSPAVDSVSSESNKSRASSVKAVEENLMKWEEERAAKMRQRDAEAAEKRRQMEEQIQKEEEERKARLEQRRREREERRQREEAEEMQRQKEREAEREARRKAHEEELRKLEEQKKAREEARRKALEEKEEKKIHRKESSTHTTEHHHSHHHHHQHAEKDKHSSKDKHKDKDKKEKSKEKHKDKHLKKQPVQEIPASKFGNIKTTERALKHVPAPNTERLDVSQVFILPDLNDPEGKKKLPDPDLLRDHFAKEGRLTRQCARSILMAAREVLLKEKNVVTIQAPVNVVGDIHGQYFDMLHLLQRAGKPGEEKKYVFLGDYVDRGTFSCEVSLYLLSVKLNYPDRVILLRGNHETRSMAIYHNFNAEAKAKYGEPIFDLFEDVFDALPLACVVETAGIGNFFCCHGGLSPSFKTIDEINELDRVMEPPDDGPLCDIIWSDPIADDQAPNQNFTRNKERSVSWVYGYNPLIDFLEENKLTSIVRAHQVKETGYEEHKFSQTPPERSFPLCITVFSAPNYCDSYQNTAAYLEIADEEYQFHQFSWQDHPYVLPDFSDGFRFSMPFVSENLMKFILDILELVDSTEDKDDVEDANEKKLMEEKMKNVGKAFLLLQRKRTENQLKLRKLGEVEPAATSSTTPVQRRGFASLVKRVQEENSRFAAAKKADEDNEKLHRDDDLKAKVLASKKRSLRNLTAGVIQRNALSPKIGK